MIPIETQLMTTESEQNKGHEPRPPTKHQIRYPKIEIDTSRRFPEFRFTKIKLFKNDARYQKNWK